MLLSSVIRESDSYFVFWPALASSHYGETSTDFMIESRMKIDLLKNMRTSQAHQKSYA